jgi:hypothetical protein
MTRRLIVVALSVSCFGIAACETSSGGGGWPYGAPGATTDTGGLAGDATKLPGDVSRTNLPDTGIPGLRTDTGMGPAIDTGLRRDIQLVVPDSGTPNLDTGGSSAATSCAAIMTCIQNECATASDPMGCMQQCQQRGDTQAQAAYNAMMMCMSQSAQGACKEKCPNPNAPDQACLACVQNACSTQIAACGSGGGTTTPTGNDSEAKAACKAIALCVFKCQGNQTCGNNCVQSNPAGSTAFIAMNNCVMQACQGKTGDELQACALQAQSPGATCAAQTDACITGSGTCSNIQTCLQGCMSNPDPMACQVNCQFAGSLEAQKQFNDFQTCALESITGTCAQSCPNGTSDTSQACGQCYNQACQAQIQTCMTGTSGGGTSGGGSSGGGGSNPFDPFGHPLPYQFSY